MVSIRSRSSWGARPPRSRSTTTWGARRGFTVHYSAGPPTQTPRQIQDFHMGPSRNYSDVAYNFLVDRQGVIYEGRGWLVVGAHAAPHNTSHIGVCFIGQDGDATPAAKAAIRALYDEACRRAGRNLSKTYHGGLAGNSTSCPGSELRAWVQAGMPASGGSTPAPKPPRPGTKAPPFPLKAGHWYGPESSDPRNHSGFYTSARPGIRQIRDRLRERGWSVAAGDRYDAKLAAVVRAFQKEKGLVDDGLVGSVTWPVLWTAPIT